MLGCLRVFISFARKNVAKVYNGKHHYKLLRQNTTFSRAFCLQKPAMKIGPTSASYSKRQLSAASLHSHTPQQESRGLSDDKRLCKKEHNIPFRKVLRPYIFNSIYVVVSSGEKRPFQKHGMKSLETLRACQDIRTMFWLRCHNSLQEIILIQGHILRTFGVGTLPPSTWAPELLQVKLGIGNQLMLVCDLPHPAFPENNRFTRKSSAKGRCSTQDAYQAPPEAPRHSCYAAMLLYLFRK